MNPRQTLASVLVALLLAGCNSNQLRPIAPPGKSTPVARLSELGIFEGDPKKQQPRAEFVA